MRVEAAELADVYVGEDGRSAVLVGQNVALLSAVATEFLITLDGGASPVAVVAVALEARFGPPPGDVDLVTAAETVAAELAAMGIVRIVAES